MADSKVTSLTELTTVLSTDILYIVSNPGVTPVDRKATVGNALAGATALIWPQGTASVSVVATGNITAGTSLIWASGTAAKWTGVTTTGNITAGTSVIWPAGTASTNLTITGNLAATGNVTASAGTITAGTTRMLFGTFPVSGVVGASNLGDFLFNNRPASGSATHWVCTAPGSPGTWLACGSAA
jgi:hypothetical protein